MSRVEYINIVMNIAETVISVTKISLLLIGSISILIAAEHGPHYLVEINAITVRATVVNIIGIALLIEFVWPMLRKAAYSSNIITDDGIMASTIFREGRLLAEAESTKYKWVPLEKDKNKLLEFSEAIKNISGASQIHDVKASKLLGLNAQHAITRDLESALEIIHYRYGGKRSELIWDARLEKQDHEQWVCTLLVKSKEADTFKFAERESAKYAPIAVLLALIKRETRLYIS